MLSYNSCSLTAWSWHYDFQTTCSLGYWFLVGSGSPAHCQHTAHPGLRGEMLQVPSVRQWHQLQTKPHWTHFCLDRETLTSHTPSQISQFNTDAKAKTLLYYYTTKLKKRHDKTSSVSWFFFQEMLCRVMKDVQLYHHSTALSVLHKFVKCKNFTHINNQLCILYTWFLLRIYWHKYA